MNSVTRPDQHVTMFYIDTELRVLKEASTRSDSVTEPERGVRGLGVGGRSQQITWVDSEKSQSKQSCNDSCERNTVVLSLSDNHVMRERGGERG